MALEKAIIGSTGLEVQSAYIKIVEYNCVGNHVSARLRAYVSKELADNGAAAIEGSEDIIAFTANYDDDASNTKKQIYEFVKSLDRYENAINV